MDEWIAWHFFQSESLKCSLKYMWHKLIWPAYICFVLLSLQQISILDSRSTYIFLIFLWFENNVCYFGRREKRCRVSPAIMGKARPKWWWFVYKVYTLCRLSKGIGKILMRFIEEHLNKSYIMLWDRMTLKNTYMLLKTFLQNSYYDFHEEKEIS